METKPTQTAKVDAYMKTFKHPLKKVMVRLREIILETDKSIGEEIKWNAPSFFFTGPMEESNPKEYKRYLIVSNVHPKQQIMLVLPHGADVDDGSGVLEGDYEDGRRLLRFYSLEDIENKEAELKEVIKKLLKKIN
jgi:hypothetical protein